MAESVCRPISYNRINKLLSSVSGKLSLATTIKYVEYCEDAWLLLRIRNYASALADKESNCKYYFIDNGILGLFLIDKDAMLLENLVALQYFPETHTVCMKTISRRHPAENRVSAANLTSE